MKAGDAPKVHERLQDRRRGGRDFGLHLLSQGSLAPPRGAITGHNQACFFHFAIQRGSSEVQRQPMAGVASSPWRPRLAPHRHPPLALQQIARMPLLPLSIASPLTHGGSDKEPA